MKYIFNGKEIEISDAELEKNMEALEITKEEAIEMWLDDHDFVKNEEAEEMTAKAKSVKRYEKSGEPRKKSTRERKVDTDKVDILNLLTADLLKDERLKDYTSKTESEFSFTFCGNPYTIKIIKHRPKK